MALWREGGWYGQALPPAGARAPHRGVDGPGAVAGVVMRTDLAGVSSFVRALGLEASCYRRLLYVCHTPGLSP